MRTWLLAITLTGSVMSVSALPEVTERLRDVAIAAGCQKDDVRVAIVWRGRGQAAEVTVYCARGPEPTP